MNKSSVFLGLAVLLSCPAVLAAPTVDPATVSVVQDGLGDKVTVSYVLADAEAIVTIDMQTNALANGSGAWASVGDANLTTFVGDVNRLVEPGKRTACWYPARERWTGAELKNLRAVVRLWPVDAPPDYLVVDLTTTNSLCYYTSEAALPAGGLANDIYRNSKFALRRIHAAGQTFQMGPSALELRTYPRSTYKSGYRHLVSFTNDYYIGVFPVTQGQVHMTTNGTIQGTGSSQPARGEQLALCYTDLPRVRGNTAAGSPYDWPDKGHAVDPTSFLGVLRARTGIEFDLPTDAQWEFACRAGTDTYWNNGSNDASTVSELAWYGLTGVQYGCSDVGRKKPNAWGLYDMHGLVWEVCLDWYAEDDSPADGEVVVEPTGPRSSASGQRIRRGGSYLQQVGDTRSTSREPVNIQNFSGYNGYRFVAPIGLKW